VLFNVISKVYPDSTRPPQPTDVTDANVIITPVGVGVGVEVFVTVGVGVNGKVLVGVGVTVGVVVTLGVLVFVGVGVSVLVGVILGVGVVVGVIGKGLDVGVGDGRGSKNVIISSIARCSPR
jgi:hypothetical protein